MFKYRAKRLDGDGGWIQGKSIQYYDDGTIYLEKDCSKSKLPNFMCPIDPSTLGVCWGMKDKNGKDVYTKQEVLYTFHNYCSSGYFQFVKDRFVLIDKNDTPSLFDDGSIEIIEEK